MASALAGIAGMRERQADRLPGTLRLLPPLVFAEKHSRQTRSAAGYRCCAHLLKFEARGCRSIDLQARWA